MKRSCLPGNDHMKASSARTVARCCHGSPGTFDTRDRLPCTTSSWLIGRTKFSLQAYTAANVIWLWCHWRCTGSLLRYTRVSCIQPMFHLKPKPRPSAYVGLVTPGQAVDSSATIMTPGWYL